MHDRSYLAMQRFNGAAPMKERKLSGRWTGHMMGLRWVLRAVWFEMMQT